MQDIHYYSIPFGWERRRLHLAMAERYGLGVEIVAFASGPVLGDRARRRSMERALLRDLSGMGRARSYHGAFIDLSLHSEDPWIAQVTRDRMEQDMETASMLGATTVVFHTGFNPLVPVSRYRTEFLNRQGSYWPRLADAWPNLTICLENLWEPDPCILEDLLQAVHHPRVGLCLDVAHAHAYGEFAVSTWMDRLSDRIRHMHWNDNFGDADTHLTIGRGNISWKEVLTTRRLRFPEATVVLELGSLEAVQQSLDFLIELSPSLDRPVSSFLSSSPSLASQPFPYST